MPVPLGSTPGPIEIDGGGVAAWRTALEADHAHTNWVFIPFASPQEFESAVAEFRKQTALQPADAAVAFLGWLRGSGRTGQFTDARLSELYAEHCMECCLMPASESHVRGCLRKLPGVTRTMREDTGSANRRRRKTVWVIAAMEIAADGATPSRRADLMRMEIAA